MGCMLLPNRLEARLSLEKTDPAMLQRTDPGDFAVFGPYRLRLAQKVLERNGRPVPLSRQAAEILTVLVRRSGTVISNSDLIAAAWPDSAVEAGSLRVIVAMLRKLLANGDADARFIANVPGQGYCFIAPVSRTIEQNSMAASDSRPRLADLPSRRPSVVGRDETIRAIAAQLEAYRFVTIVGAGGIGKTTVAVSVGHEISERFAGDIRFFDLGPVTDPEIVVSAIASTLGVSATTSAPLDSLIAFLRGKRMMLIFDSCEHIIDVVSLLSERIFAETSVHILATSREALRVEGERLHQLHPLVFPTDATGMAATAAIEYSAINLFVDRARAAAADFILADADVPVVAEICRKLDGIALAIELAAGRVGAFGLQQMSTLIEGRTKMLWAGRRNAPTRQRTLDATLDWSYDLLDDTERLVLRRLSVFVGTFSLSAARAIAGDASLDHLAIAGIVASLVSKSLLSLDLNGSSPRYRLLDMTRSFAAGKLRESGEADIIARRHAANCHEKLRSNNDQIEDFLKAPDHAPYEEGIDNLRAALQWCFSTGGDRSLGIALAVESPSQFLSMSLLQECAYWSETAIAALGEDMRGTRIEMILQGALGMSLRWANDDKFRGAFARSLEVAAAIGEKDGQIHLLHHLRVIELSHGNTQRALALAERSLEVARAATDPLQLAVAEATLGIIHQTIGSQALSRSYCEAALDHAAMSSEKSAHIFNSYIFRQAEFALSNSLWHLGFADQALRLARAKIEEAQSTENFMLWSEAVLWCGNVHIWSGAWHELKVYTDRLLLMSVRHPGLKTAAFVENLHAGVLTHSGELEEGIARLRKFLVAPARNHASHLLCNMLLIPGLIRHGELGEALSLVERALATETETGKSRWYPEIVRLKADILARTSAANDGLALDLCYAAIETARGQSSLGWELRSTITLCEVLQRQGEGTKARQILRPLLEKFTEGFGAEDLVKANNFLESLVK